MFNRILALVALLFPVLVLANDPPEKKETTAQSTATDLGTLIVTATRAEQTTNTTPAFLTVISRDDIERSGATQVVDVLRGRAGVEVTDLFGDGSRPNVGLRGFGENAPSNTLVLVDGRRLNNPDIASQDFNSIPLDTVERIEVMQGSAGALYGDQAVGGVINIITRAPRRSGATVELDTGSYGRGGGRASGSYTVSPDLRLGFDANAQHGDNYRAHNRLDLYSLGGRGDYDWVSGGLFVELRHEDERLQLPGALLQAQLDANRRQVATTSANDFNNSTTQAVRAGVRQALNPGWSLLGEISSRTSSGEFRLQGTGGTQNRRTYGLTPRLTGSCPVWGGQNAQVTLGSDIYLSEYRINAFGPQQNDQQTYDGYAQAVIPFVPGAGLTAAARYGSVHNRLRDGGAFAIFPAGQRINDEQIARSAGIFWFANPGLKLFARYDHSFRYAKVDEYFGTFAAASAVNLKTQTGDSFETGAEYHGQGLNASLLLYRLDLDNEIIFDPTAGTNTNLPRSRRDGQLVELRYPLTGVLTAFGSYTHVEVKARLGALAGKTIPLTAEHQGRAGLEWSPVKPLNVFIEAQAYSERFFGGDFDNTLAPLPSYQVLNLGGTFHAASGLRAQVRVNNLLSERYSETGFSTFNPFPTEAPSYFPSPEINFQATLGYTFGG